MCSYSNASGPKVHGQLYFFASTALDLHVINYSGTGLSDTSFERHYVFYGTFSK